MYLIPIAWLYVALMMAIAEATNTTGTVLGALITLLLYGVAPVCLLMYILGTPSRRRAIKARELAEDARARAALSDPPDRSSDAATDPITPMRKE